MNSVYRSVWNGALGAWVAVSEAASGHGKGGCRHLLVGGVAAVALVGVPAHAADIEYLSTGAAAYMDNPLLWQGGRLPGLSDRGVISGPTINLSAGSAPGAVSIGSLWITSGAGVRQLNPQASWLSLAGINGIGIQSDSPNGIQFIRNVTLLGDISIRVTHIAGGGISFARAINASPSSTIDIGNYTLTLDPVNAVNTVNGINAGIIGTGNVVKTGAGRSTWSTSASSVASLLAYTGFTDIRQGTFALTGIASLHNASRVNVDGTLDISGTVNGTNIGNTTNTPDGSSLRNLTGTGQVLLGARNLHLMAGQSDFSGAISGTGALFIEGGEATLRTANSHAGGTELKSGRLNVGHNQALGTGALAMDDGTTLGFVADGLNIANDIVMTGTNDPIIDTGAFNETLSGVISGGGFLTKQGTGTLTLTGANIHTGATNVAAGTLKAGAANVFSAASAHMVGAGGTLDLAGFNQTLASMDVAGMVSTVGAAPGTTLTANGLWRGSGGTLRLGTALNGDGSASDRLVLDGAGASASGSTTLQIVNLGGLGAQTTGDGIEVVTAQGGATSTAQTTRDAFALQSGHVDAGAYEYHLFAADAAGLGENWYLRSTRAASDTVMYRAEVPLLTALPEQLRQSGLVMLGNLHQRVGDERQGGAEQRHSWARLISTERQIAQGGTIAPVSHTRFNGVQAGIDLWNEPEWRAGLSLGQLEGNSRVRGFSGGIENLAVGGTDLRSRYLGAYATHHRASGLYADAVLQFGDHRYTLKPHAAPAERAGASSWLASLEVGQPFHVRSNWQVEPQLQLVYQHMDVSDVQITNAQVQVNTRGSWLARAGLRVKTSMSTRLGILQPYGRVNVYHASNGSDVASFGVAVGSKSFATRVGGTSTEAALGMTLEVSPRASVYAELGTLWASGGDSRSSGGLNGSAGMRWLW
ncbi:autotransporter outer membrane beta-barrel domain-containing protein [Hydrogenophaga sp.]|uniref:autotransporter outer membrane beta-barrel domain-containing protein n=1 Tax=Hydrogenophaga sp. TaxID=1904254 RepID=UPI002FC8DB13